VTGNDLLIVDDLVLLLMDDDGASVQGAGILHHTLGGAVLTELALLGRVQTDDTGIVTAPRVTPAGVGPLPHPVLQSAHESVAARTQRVQPLLLGLGGDLWRVVRDRLVDRGLLRREGAPLARGAPQHEVAGRRREARGAAAGGQGAGARECGPAAVGTALTRTAAGIAAVTISGSVFGR
jgi:hypothetical protein